MNRMSAARSLVSLSLVALTGALASACGGAPPDADRPESTASTESADTGACVATTSCAGVVGGPPEITITCPSGDVTYFVWDVTPSGASSEVAVSTPYSTSMSDYSGSLKACQVEEIDWGLVVIQSTCQTFSTYAPPDTWCAGAPTGGGGGGGGRGGGVKNGGCSGTCS